MDWNLSIEVQRKLETLAQHEALLSQEGHAYLPKTPEEADKFNPHEWVLEAMRRAYVTGRHDGAKMTRADIRAVLGIKEGGA